MSQQFTRTWEAALEGSITFMSQQFTRTWEAALEGSITFMSQQFTRMWEAAQQSLQTAQKKQKHHDHHAKERNFEVGDRVFILTPTLKQGHAYKPVSPFKGPYQVVGTHANGLDMVVISKPFSPSIRVALNRIRCCPEEMQVPGDQTPPAVDGGEEVARDAGGTPSPVGDVISDGQAEPETPTDRHSKRDTTDVDQPGTADGVWGGAMWRARLRSRSSARGRVEVESREM